MNREIILNYLLIACIFAVIIGGGLFVINQFFAWHYKAYLLQKPCDLCISLNPNYTRCYQQQISTGDNRVNLTYSLDFEKLKSN